MKYTFILLFSLASLAALHGQRVNIYFPEPAHDFGDIKEDGGIVGHWFTFINDGSAPVRIVDAKANCGCTVAKWNGQPVSPGDSSKVFVLYDPKDRPGSFVKSVDITYDGGSLRTISVNIRGRVLSQEEIAEMAEAINSLNLPVYRVEFFIKPYRANNLYAINYLQQDPDFVRFIKDIEKVIEQDEFANVLIGLYEPPITNDPEFRKEITLIKTAIIIALQDLGHASYNVGFQTEIQLRRPKGQTSMLKLASLDYNGEQIVHSKFPLGEVSLTKDEGVARNVDELLAGYEVADYFRFGVNEKAEGGAYKNFISGAVRDIVRNGSTSIRVRAIRTSDVRGDMKMMKSLRAMTAKLEKKVLSDLASQGFEASSVKLLETEVRVEDSTLFSSADNLRLNFLEVSRIFQEDVLLEDLSDYADGEPGEEPTTTTPDTARKGLLPGAQIVPLKFEYSHSVLPVYQEFIVGRYSALDTGAIGFRVMMDKVIKEIKAGKKVDIMIESSASKTPSQENYTNEFIARKRARLSGELIQEYGMKHGLRLGQLKIIDPISLVQGPEYHKSDYPLEFYRQFQYLKVAPVYSSEPIADLKDRLRPYMVTFHLDDFELNTGSEVYKTFIARIAEVINYQGYLKIIIESSASYVPSSIYPSNDILAYYRADDAKNRIHNSLRDIGVDPRRLLIMESRILVQGPEYVGDYESNRAKYGKYQYIKLIPHDLLN